MSTEIEMDSGGYNHRSSKIIPGLDEGSVEGLQYRRGSRKLSLTLAGDIIKSEKLVNDSAEDELSHEEVIPYAPDGGYGWVIVFASFLCNFVLDGISLSQSALMDDIRIASGVVNAMDDRNAGTVSANSTAVPPLESLEKEPEYEITVALYTLVSAVLLSVTLSVGPFVSLLTDRFGFRAVSMCGSILASLGIFLSYAISPHTPNIWASVVFFGFFGGIGFGMMFQPSIVIVGIYFEKWRPLATGIAISGTGAGIFAFPPVNAAVSKTWGWQGAYIFLAGMALLSATFAFFYFPLPTKRVKINTKITENHTQRRPSFPSPEAEKFGLRSMVKAMGPLSTSPTFLLISISGGITMLGFFAPYSYLSDKGLKELNLDEKTATFLVSIVGIANVAGRLIFGLISCHPWVNSLILSNGALTVTGIATLLVPFATEHYQLVLYAIVFGFGIAIFTVLRSILVLKFMGMEKFNNAFGLSLLFMGVGTLIGIPFGGWLKDHTGNYDISFYAAGTYLLVSGVMCYPLQHISDWENKRKQRGGAGSTTNESVTQRKSLAL